MQNEMCTILNFCRLLVNQGPPFNLPLNKPRPTDPRPQAIHNGHKSYPPGVATVRLTAHLAWPPGTPCPDMGASTDHAAGAGAGATLLPIPPAAAYTPDAAKLPPLPIPGPPGAGEKIPVCPPGTGADPPPLPPGAGA